MVAYLVIRPTLRRSVRDRTGVSARYRSTRPPRSTTSGARECLRNTTLMCGGLQCCCRMAQYFARCVRGQRNDTPVAIPIECSTSSSLKTALVSERQCFLESRYFKDLPPAFFELIATASLRSKCNRPGWKRCFPRYYPCQARRVRNVSAGNRY